MNKTKRYVAITGKSGASRILSVFAENESEARQRIREQLDRPGRRRVLKRWQNSGKRVKVEEAS